MKNIDILTTLSPRQQYEIRRWFMLTSALFCITLISCSIILIPYSVTIYALYKKQNMLQNQVAPNKEIITVHTQLQKEYDTLSHKQTKIAHKKTSSKNPYEYIASIATAQKHTICIQNIRQHKKDIEYTIVCNTPALATNMIEILHNTHKFEQLALINLQQQEHGFRCVLKGKIS